jgi:BirA family biotin operon repressor/biotin-[acetyl-CoA-carboxylase] ligase
MSARDALGAEKLCADVDAAIIGREILVLGETSSTNDSVFERVSPSTREGLVVFAERQTAGRGQRSNSWESAAGKGLWFSIFLRPKIDIGDSPQLARWSAETIAKTISEKFDLSTSFKLPNDVLVAGKKIGGVLVEMRAQENAPHIAIVGIGVNVNHRAEDFSEEVRDRAISLSMALDREIDRHQFAVALLRNLDRTYGEVFARNP